MNKFLNQSKFSKAFLTTTSIFTILAASEASAVGGKRDHHYRHGHHSKHRHSSVNPKQFANDLAPIFANRGYDINSFHSPAEALDAVYTMNLNPQEIEIFAKNYRVIMQALNQFKKQIQNMPEGNEKSQSLAELEATRQKMKELRSKMEAEYPAQHSSSENELNASAALDIISVAKALKAQDNGLINIGHTSLQESYANNKEVLDALADAIKKDPIAALKGMEGLGLTLTADTSIKNIANDTEASKLNSNQQALHHFAHFNHALPTQKEKAAELAKTRSQVLRTPAANHALPVVVSHIMSRLAFIKVADSGLGTSAGDDVTATPRGVWISGTFGSDLQQKTGLHAGYKGKLLSATVGADIPLNENIILGAAYSNVTSKFNYKQDRTGDKSTARINAFSVYGQFENNNILWTNIASLATGRVTNKNSRVSIATATGKIKSKTFGFETNLGYKITQGDVTFIPNIGLRYTVNKDGSYTETGAGGYNMQVAKRCDDSITGIIGIKIMSLYKASDEVDIIPGAHVALENNFKNKTQKVKLKYTWMPDYLSIAAATGDKVPSLSYNAGLSLMARTSGFEASVGYDFKGMKKFQSHQGTLKLKVLF